MVSMHEVASLKAPEIEPPNAIAASAIVDPTMARIRAYSAAEAPLSSRRNEVTKLRIILPLFKV